MNNNKFNDILNECLDRILRGETVEQCLRSYPEQATELEPLLRTAMAAKIVSNVKPRPEFKAKAKLEFQAALHKMEAKKSERTGLFHWHWQWQSGWAMAIIGALVVVMAGSGTVAAAGNSMPDNTLYPVKLATENVQMALTFSDIGKAELNAELADKRAEEMVYLASKGDPQKVQIVAQHLNGNLKNLSALAGEKGRETSGSAVQSENAVSSSAVDSHPMLAAAPTAAPATSLDKSGNQLNVQGQDTPAAGATDATSDDDNPPAFQGAARANPETPAANASVPSPSPAKGNGKDTDREKLRKIITDNAASNQAKLNEALKKASPEVRPALRQALAQSETEYNKALMNLEQSPGRN